MKEEHFPYFPYEKVRPGQDKFIEKVQYCIRNKKHLIAHAPTGVGKTAVLGPILHYAIENDLHVFFLTPRNTQHRIAIETIERIKEKYNLSIATVDLIGKKKMCAQPGVDKMLSSGEFGEYCRDLIEKKQCSYYNNFLEKRDREKTLNKLEGLNPLSVEEAINISKEAMLCPPEMSYLIAKKANLIIADYYHVLDPDTRNGLFKKINKGLGRSIVIFDEAHYIINRGRNLLTWTLSTYTLDQAIKELNQFNHADDAKRIADIKNNLEGLIKAMPFNESEIEYNKLDFYKQIKDYEGLISNLSSISDEIREVKERSFVGGIATFLKAWLGEDEGFVRIFKRDFDKKGKPFLSLTYKGLDPSILMKPLINEAYSLICFSGTLTPTSMYKQLFGFDNVEEAEFENNYPKENRLEMIIPETTTMFNYRNEAMFKRIAKKIADISNEIVGNVAIFFPSYKLRDDIYNHFSSLGEKTIFLERPDLNKKDKEDLLDNLKKYKDSGAVLLAVSSGSYGEGIDLPGNYLNGVIVVGLPLAKPDLETKALRRYYEAKFGLGKGLDYGYIQPAMLKILQNGGRCIRSETDKGVIAYLELRLNKDPYFKYFPDRSNIDITTDPLKKIENFNLHHRLIG